VDYFGGDLVFTIMLGIIVVLLVIAVIGIRHHLYKAKFNPEFRSLSDGSLQMEFAGFGGIQTTRTKRFYEQYRIGMKVEYQGNEYQIEEIQQQSDPSMIRRDVIMICYLKEFGRYGK